MLTIVCSTLCILKVSLCLNFVSMNKTKILVVFGNNVRESRRKTGLSQEELAFKANLHRTYIGMIERAEKNITLTNVEKVARALNVSICDLINE